MKKKNLIITLSCLFFSVISYAQLSLGLKMGGSYSSMGLNYARDNFDAYLNKGSEFGFIFGAVGEVSFGSRLGLQIEALFSQRGVSLASIGNATTSTNFPFNGTFKNNQTINYIEVPVFFKYNFGAREEGFAIVAGPDFAFGIGGSYTQTGDFVGKGSLTFGNKASNNYNALDLGLGLGAGYRFEVGEGSMMVEARYVFGLNNIINDNYDSTINNKGNFNIINDPTLVSEAHNSCFQLGVTYYFHLGN